MIGIAWLRDAAGRGRRSRLAAVGVGVVIVTLACGALPALSAEGESAAPSGSEPTSDTGTPSCPSSNPPNRLTLVAGTPQSATLGNAFATNLQIAFTNSNGCPVTTTVAGIPVTFSAPSAGASGVFTGSGSSTVTVGSDASGMAGGPAFTANDVAGSYTVTASSTYGSVSFSLRNAEGSGSSSCGVGSSGAPQTGAAPMSLAGRPTKLATGVGTSQSTRTGTGFPLRFAVTVTDAEKNPVPGVLVTFAAPARGPSGHFTIRSNSAKGRGLRTSYPSRVEVKTDRCGIAVAPRFTADERQGGYIVVASVERVRAAFALVNEGP
jgi:hypothetical protein